MYGDIPLATSSRPFFFLEPRSVPRPWGGVSVARRFGWNTVEPVGEWWLASVRDDAGTNLRGETRDLARWLDDEGCGRGTPTAADFPLLVKFLDARTTLSVQVHPDDAVASAHGLPNGKTEAWHILDAEPGAFVYMGLAEGVDPAQLLEVLSRPGVRDADVIPLLSRVHVESGDTLVVEAGTVHAVAGGVSLYEVQQNSDATYRLFDWGRGRQLHLDEARDALKPQGPVEPVRPDDTFNQWQTLVDTSCFRLLRTLVSKRATFRPVGEWAVLTVLSGEGRLSAGSTTSPVAPGDTVLVLGGIELHGSGLEVLATEEGQPL